MKNPARKTTPKQKKPPKRITATYLHNAGLYYLQKFSASKKHFELVLMRKVKKSCAHHEDQDFETCARLVSETVTKFERAGLLNDELYAEGMASSLRRGGKSRKAIIMKMNIKGLPNDLAGKALEQYDTAEHGDSSQSEYAAALKFARKKRLASFATPPRAANEKDLAAFARAGFSYDLARKILNADPAEFY